MSEKLERKVRDAVDNLGNPVEIWWRARLEGAPCIDLIYDTFSELIKKNISNHTITIDNAHRLAYIKYSGSDQIVAGIAYKWLEQNLVLWTSISFTHKDYRGRGLNKLCREVLDIDGARLGATCVGSYVHIDNKAGLESTQKYGMKPTYIKMFKPLD